MYRDQQLLGGFLNSQDAFSRIDDKILYSGAEAIALNLNANQALGAFSVFYEGEQLQAGVNSDTRLVDMRYGDGITPGLLRVSGGGDWYDLDLTAATTMGVW
ncbi:MAG: hypothetical protein ACR2OA_00550 [Rubripirellula sp.]|jgi:flagellar hook-associated protein 3 FlgL